MQKKKLRGISAVCLLCLSLAGCSAAVSTDKSSEQANIVIWHYYNGQQKEAFDRLVEEFNDTVGDEKQIVVTAESKGNVDELAAAVGDSVEEKVGSDKLPDIFATYADMALVLYEKDYLVDLSTYMTEEELASYVPAFLEEGSLRGDGLQVLPVAKSTELFYLNVTDWETFAQETGVQESAFETWEGLAQVAEQYYNWSGGKAFFGRDAFANYMIVGSRQLGAPIFQIDENGVTVELNEDVMRRLWDYYAVPYLKGYYGAYGRFRSDDVKTGDLLACVASTSSVTYYPSEVTMEDGSTYPIDVKVYDLPDFEDTEPYAVQQGAGMAVIRSGEAREKAAVEFLKWFTDAAQNTEFCVNSGYFPVKTEANRTENIKAFMAEAGIAEGSLSYDNFLMSSGAVERSTLYTNKAFAGGIDARSVLTRYMTDELQRYYEELQAMIAEGISREAAWESYMTDELFERWMTGLQEELEAAV